MNTVTGTRSARSAAAVASKHSFGRHASYLLSLTLTRLIAVAFFALRCFGRQNIPRSGPTLVCANHQSFMDPILVGAMFGHRVNYLARKTLFRFRLLKWLMEAFDAIPVDQEGSGLHGLKESLKRLRQGEMLVIFPEGARTPDGEIAPLMAGVCLLARRAMAPILPLGLDGPYHAWPITALFPKFARLCVVIGKPIQPEQIAAWDDERLLAEIDFRIRDCHRRAREVRSGIGYSTRTSDGVR